LVVAEPSVFFSLTLWVVQLCAQLCAVFGKLRDRVPAVQSILLPGQTADEISAQVELETKTVGELLDLNIWDHVETKLLHCHVSKA